MSLEVRASKLERLCFAITLVYVIALITSVGLAWGGILNNDSVLFRRAVGLAIFLGEIVGLPLVLMKAVHFAGRLLRAQSDDRDSIVPDLCGLLASLLLSAAAVAILEAGIGAFFR